MTSDWLMHLYWRLPVSLQETALSLYACYLDRRYYGDGYEEWRQRFIEWRQWSHEEAVTWQERRLRSLLQLAATTVPYYRAQWRDLDWKAVRSIADLPLLPLVEKQAIRQHAKAFLVEGLNPQRLWVEKTGGTTGNALTAYWPLSMLPQWWALVEVMVRNVAGVAQELPRAMMGGRPIVPGNTCQPPYWRFNRRWQQLYLSSYHVSRSSAPAYIDAIRTYRSRWITGYGSAIAALAEYALEGGVEPLPMHAVIVSGDTLLPGMRTSIERFFRCKCFDHYGQSEGVCMAMECEHGRMHVIPQAGIVEIVRADGTPCAPGEVGEIVATGLLNDAMPLIRYRLGDYAAWAPEQSCPCGNRQPIIASLEGRTDDYLITKDGRKIGRLSTAFKRSPTIHSAQLVQDRPGHAYVLVRPGDGYRHTDALRVCEDIVEKIGTFELTIVEVADIPKTPRGKTALVIRLADRPAMQPLYEAVLRQAA